MRPINTVDRIVGSTRHVKDTVEQVSKKEAKVSHPGMMGDGTEEQNLDERGKPAARIKKVEVDATFGKSNLKK